MGNRIDQCFARLRAEGKKAFVAYQTCGDPDLERSFAISRALAECGVDILELGIPFSDPLADGPTIQAASQRAIDAGASLPRILERLADFRKTCEVPIVLFTYLNPIFTYGFQRFQRDAVGAGADGLLILDLPPEEAAANPDLVPYEGLHSIRLVAPTTPESRLPGILRGAGGFVYYVSREGVTGEQRVLSDSIGERVALIRSHTTHPVVVGFGISNPQQAAEVAAHADGVVIGSAIVRRIAENAASPDLVERIAAFVRPIAEAVHAQRSD
jgi:tryptophan synthase alpha chain